MNAANIRSFEVNREEKQRVIEKVCKALSPLC
jgi:hypothetical protein